MGLSDDFREEAEAHWKFLQKLSFHRLVINDVPHYDEATVKYLYVEAMAHGFKHGKQRFEKKADAET